MRWLERIRGWAAFEWLTLAGVLAFVALPFTCLRRATRAGVVELRFWVGGDAKWQEPYRRALDDFEAAHPGIRVRLEQVPGDLGRKYLSAMQAGNCADVLNLHWTVVPSFAAKGALVPLDELCRADRYDLDGFFSTMLDAYRYRSKLYGLPFQGSTYMIFYNKDLFDAARVAYPNENWTWDDFLAGSVRRAPC